MEAYVYQAALLCADCATERRLELEFHNMWDGSCCVFNPWPHSWQESDYYPQGPYPDGGGEADTPQHCDGCGVFLENALTGNGTRYVNEKLIEYARDGSGAKDVLETWAKHYNGQVYEPGSVTLEHLQSEYSLEDDEWGACMGWWFRIAGELYARYVTLPKEWKYKPGIHPVDPDDRNAPLVAGAPAETLFEFVKTVEAEAERLKAESKDY
jgi:hypothetical protein